MSEQYRRRVGTVRPSHLMFTSGVGALVDLPNFSVLVSGLDEWRYDRVPEQTAIAEPRLLEAVQRLSGGQQVKELRPAPWMEDTDPGPNSPAARVGVPTVPFPAWLRCTACNELAPLAQRIFQFENDKPSRPHDARFFHGDCRRKRSGRRPLAVPARFVVACTAGHLDDFPYAPFVHRGQPCPKAAQPRLQMEDRGGNLGANVTIRCVNCGQRRNMREALGRDGRGALPRCRGRHPHLGTFDPHGCDGEVRVLVVGASNQWFAQTLSVLSVPRTDTSELDDRVNTYWAQVSPLAPAMYGYAREHVPAFQELRRWDDGAIAAAVQRVRARRENEQEDTDDSQGGYPDLRTPEWEAFSARPAPDPGDDFALRRDPGGVPAPLDRLFCDVVQVERLREVRALVGFTRLDAPDFEDPDLVTRAPLTRGAPEWLPASEVRGEGVFVRVSEDVLCDWERRVADSEALRRHRDAYARYRRNRYSDRIKGPFDPMRHWPGARYIALHTLSHLLLRTIALDCGYNAASLSERVYAGGPEDPRGGILIYTAVPDAEGTLGGLVSQAEPDRLVRLVRRALHDATRCSSDPLCRERLPQSHDDFLHGAACHVCLFVSETTCERGNRFLDRRFVVPVDDPSLALLPELP
ncbi:DUF1998 domain-containing protein [Thermobifida halotolerans]|uniref:DUF1998 domain-containing protein n=1 Tax=Thermobifida halotolerans TaxID=483545 RepID=A0A399G9E9_9ACTN|nr:DUF1998 domain-containing protein [Thermobifida halotolerans]UOE18600.1 DUF1998 domain-containing protein [Thermobifida halotolerans]